MTGAKEYAVALFSLTEELKTTESALEDAKICKSAFTNNKEYFNLADTPSVPLEEKLSLIRAAFGSVGESVLNLLLILCEKHSVRLFPAIADEYLALYNEARGIIEAEALSAVALDGVTLKRLKDKLERVTGKKVTVKNTVDKSLLGGIKLRYMGRQLDGTLKTKLEGIEKNLKNTII